jgi:hypothetical protein
MIQRVASVKPVNLLHDISTKTGEEVMMFTLAESPPSAKHQWGRGGAIGKGRQGYVFQPPLTSNGFADSQASGEAYRVVTGVS